MTTHAYLSAEYVRREARALAYWETLAAQWPGVPTASAWGQIDDIAREYARGERDLASAKQLMSDAMSTLAVVADWRGTRDYAADMTDAEIIAEVRNVLRLPDAPPVPGAHPLNDDGTPLYAAYVTVLSE